MRNKFFLKSVMTFALPITVQLLITSALSMVDSLMIGNFGESAIASVGIINKYSQFITVILQGFISGATIFCAQYYGAKNYRKFKQILVLVSCLVVCFSLVATIILILFREKLTLIYTSDIEILIISKWYYVIIASSFIFTSLSMTMTVGLKTMAIINKPTIISIFTLLLNTVLNWLFIYGNLGFISLGITGAGIATLFSRIIQSILLSIILINRLPFSKNELHIDFSEFKLYIKITMPSILNHITWTLGDLVFFYIYSKLNTYALAAVTLIDPLVFIFICVFSGVSDAASILIGNNLGAKNYLLASQLASKFIVLVINLSVIVIFLIYKFSPLILANFNITAETKQLVEVILIINIFILPFKNVNYVNNVGILRVGGDTKFVLYLDSITVWIFSIPIAFLFFKMGYSLPIIYLAANSHEIIRATVGLYRTFNKKWLKTLI
ncbi:MATE family efflux transporter [Aerococcaceae bacterium zg-BR22]|uniref:MATE family efflux transporter n=1 Tax=Aerococcaceae bacterium zg-1292 TaxID=2774330 RepID=UPI0040647FB3|nr:MATE family efflux transporter [Aerococcaceae bacterium zg-BR22]